MLRRITTAGIALAVTLGAAAVPAVADPASPAGTGAGAEARTGAGAEARTEARTEARAEADAGLGPRSLAVSAADKAAASGLDSLAKGLSEKYERTRVTPWVKGLYSVAYERSYRGLPVVGGDVVVLADGKGKVRAVSAAAGRQTRINVPTTAEVSKAAAERTSRAELERTERVDSQRLVVHMRGGKPRLAWETVLTGSTREAPGHLNVWVDALSGKVIATHDDVAAGTGHSEWNGPSPLSIDTTYSGGSYSLRDPDRPGVSCADFSTGSVLTKSTDSWGNGDASSKETGCVDTMWAAQKEWDMLGEWLGRDGHDGNGRGFPVKVGLNQVNAYWNGSSVAIGHNSANEWIASMDVVGHEIGHGIDQFTPGGANNENGLGEATGDIFGALTEAYANEPAPYDTPGDYLVGETINLSGSGPIRNMYDPSKLGTRTAGRPRSPTPRCTPRPAR